MKSRLLFILAAIFVSHSFAEIIPTPQSIVEKKFHFKISSSTKIVLGSNTQAEQFIAELLNEEMLSRNAAVLKVVGEKAVRKLASNYLFIGKPSTEYGKKFLTERKGKLNPAMKTEGYFLDVDVNGIVIIAESEKGMMYGAMSLIQLLEREKRSLIVRGVSIHDFPSQKIRGITDDISRGQISTMENFKKIIRFCARYKMNVYSPYIEDMFRFSKHPDIGRGRGALTANECRELDTYAKKYFVEVIPIFETLGHWENILILPTYERYGEFPGAHTVNVSEEKVYALLDEMIGEIASSFSSPYFNIAADESWDVGLGVNKERVKKSSLATVHAEHYKRIFESVKKHGKKVMMYGDIILDHTEILSMIPKDVLMVDWHYGASFDYSSPEIFKNAGFPYVVSPAVWNFSGPFPNYINTFLNIQHLNNDGYRNGSEGILCSNWNDYGGEALREFNYYGYAWTAECAWNPDRAEQNTFSQKFFKDFFNTDDANELRSVYTVLSNPVNQYHWYELWRHPMLPSREDMIWEKRLPHIQRMQSMKTSMPLVLELVDNAEKKVGANKDHLQYLRWIARMNLWYADKYEAQEKIKLSLKDTLRSRTDIAAQAAAICDEVITKLGDVKSEFQQLWGLTNRPEGLELILKRYDRQAEYWKETAEFIRRGDTILDPSIKSQWIYHPKSNPNMKDSMQVPAAYFLKQLPTGKIASAKVQLLGDTWVKLYINGTLVGDISARRSLSLTVEQQRAKIFDITSLLNDSNNVIAVEAKNFHEFGSAGVNIYGEATFADGAKIFITTDETWSVSDSVSTDWKAGKTGAGSWLSAAPKKYPTPVVAPNFATGRTSWYER